MKTKVLLIDDDEAIRESLKQILQAEDFEVTLASDGQTAVEQFEPNRFDLVLLDLDLPVRSGWEVFCEIKSWQPSRPVIVITGHNNQQRVASDAGVDGFMEKPIDPLQLLQTIKEVLAEPVDRRLNRFVARKTQGETPAADAATFFKDYRERHPLPPGWDGPAMSRLTP